MPTVLDALGIDPPTHIGGVQQAPIEGVSLRHTVSDANADSTRRHFEENDWYGLEGQVRFVRQRMLPAVDADGTRAGYVRANDLYVEDLESGEIMRLTHDGSTTIINGTFDCASLGSGTASIGGAFSVNGKVQTGASGSGSVGSPLFFGPFVFSGTVAEGVMWGTFDFTNPGGGEGTAVLTNEATAATAGRELAQRPAALHSPARR